MNMRNIFSAVLLTALVLPGAGGARKGELEKNKALAQRVFDEILNQGKYEVFGEIYAKDFIKHVDRRNATLAQEMEDAKAMRTASSDLVMTVDQMIAESNKVAILYTGRGTHTGPFGDIPATGKKYVVSGMTVYRFANGKIAEEWTTYNMLDILGQLGYYPGPGKKN